VDLQIEDCMCERNSNMTTAAWGVTFEPTLNGRAGRIRSVAGSRLEKQLWCNCLQRMREPNTEGGWARGKFSPPAASFSWRCVNNQFAAANWKVTFLLPALIAGLGLIMASGVAAQTLPPCIDRS
jgi:hypothetical protein